MGILVEKAKEAANLNRELRESRRLLDLPGGGQSPGGVGTGDFKRLRRDVQRLGNQIAGIGGGGGQVDPFLTDLARGAGPRRA